MPISILNLSFLLLLPLQVSRFAFRISPVVYISHFVQPISINCIHYSLEIDAKHLFKVSSFVGLPVVRIRIICVGCDFIDSIPHIWNRLFNRIPIEFRAQWYIVHVLLTFEIAWILCLCLNIPLCVTFISFMLLLVWNRNQRRFRTNGFTFITFHN